MLVNNITIWKPQHELNPILVMHNDVINQEWEVFLSMHSTLALLHCTVFSSA
jgi:hypothetical protein